ncbi:MAG: C25 family cysteine peptidase [Pirellulales bacterium]
MSTLLLWLLIAIAPPTAPDTLVVCPPQLRIALAPWEEHRAAQGHLLQVIAPPRTALELRQLLSTAARSKQLKYVVLIGDVDTVPTCYAEAKVNILWGSEPTIATDEPYADVDDDGVPDIAVGRIPADSRAELQAVVRKLLQYEHAPVANPCRRQLDVVAGVGGFGIVADTLIEASARSVFTQVVPASYSVRRLKADPEATCEQISAGSLAWIYLGHGLPTMLDVAATPHGPKPILAVSDVAKLQCGANCPLAVLVACYTGAIDARTDSLAEKLVLEERGPIAAIAATRVTMPYGNSVFGCELLRAAFRNSPGNFGDVWLRAQRQTLAPAAESDSLRSSLDAVARGVSPPPADLAAERREHVLLYQLLGDPLLRLNYPAAEHQRIAATSEETIAK